MVCIACFHLDDVGDERLIYTTLHCFAVHICNVLKEAFIYTFSMQGRHRQGICVAHVAI
jgi:hypothetical protein